MALFKQRESRILKDPSWLQPLSPPPGGKPLCRDPDLKHMATYLTDLFKIGQARNLFIFGKPGTGKTACIKHLLTEIRRHATEENIPLATIYVNAGKTRTPYYTMLEIVQRLGLEVPDRGWQMYRLKQVFEKAREEQAILIAIDEVDAIIFKEKEPLVYYLNRQPKTTLILLSNKIEDATTLPPRALRPYNQNSSDLSLTLQKKQKPSLPKEPKKALKPNTIPN